MNGTKTMAGMKFATLNLERPIMLRPSAKIITPPAQVISAISATYMTEAALQEGAWGYIVKGVSARSIAEHLLNVTASGAVRPVRPYPLSRDFEDRHHLEA